MKHKTHNRGLARIVAFNVLAVLVFAGLLALPAYAQNTAWRLDAEHSTAQLFAGAGQDPVNVGVARIDGRAMLDSADITQSSFNFTIDPHRSSSKSNDPDLDQISFRSKDVRMTHEGNLEFTGDLQVTRLVRNVYLDPSEGYYGANYGQAVPVTETRRVTFVVPGANSAMAQAKDGKLNLSASTQISREQFPAFFSAVAETNWPSVVVKDENCQVPANLGEGYSGAICTGTPVEQASNGVAPATGTIGEDYHGFEPAAIVDGRSSTIVVHLAMTQVASGSSGSAGGEGSAEEAANY